MTVRVRSLLLVVLVSVIALGVPRAAKAAPPAGDVAFAPQGTVKQVRQVTARFRGAMVALGDPRATLAPFAIDCAEPGSARWIDARTWAYDFDRTLPAGVRCTFTLRDGVTTRDGTPLRAAAPFRFSTGGPAIESAAPYAGASAIEEDQAFILRLDAEPTPASVLAHVGFAVDGLPERVSVRIVEGEERDAILRAQPYGNRPPMVVLQGTRRFPDGAKVRLVWGAGVATASGVATTIDQVLDYVVRPALTVSFTCGRSKRDGPCLPVTSMRVEFSAPVPWEQAGRITLTGSDGTARSPRASDEQVVSSVVFPGPFPELAEFRIALPDGLADESGRTPVNVARYPLTVKTGEYPPLAKFSSRFGIIEWKADPTLPVTLRNLEPDVAGRMLDVTAPVRGSVVRLPPEQEADILPWLRRVGFARRATSVFAPPPVPTATPVPGKARSAAPTATATATDASPTPGASPVTFTLPKPGGEKAFEVVGIPLAKPGLYVVELESARLGASLLATPKTMYVPTAALVTNMSVHFKWGEEASLAWVTTLEDAKPVPNALVTVRDCTGAARFEGRTDTDGIVRIPALPRRADLPDCFPPGGTPEDDGFDYSQTRALRQLFGGLLVTARTDDDLSFVHSSWQEGIEPWRFDLPDDPWAGRFSAHTILDRALVRAGDTLHMKHLFRTQTLAGFGVADGTKLPTTLVLRHAGSGQEYVQPVAFDGAGIAESTWAIPREAKLGRYEVVLRRESATPTPTPGPTPVAAAATDAAPSDDEEGWDEGSDDAEWTTGELRVEEFRVPLMRGVLQVPADPIVAAESVPVDVAVRYLAGGGAGELPVVVRAQISPRTAAPPDELERFLFANGPVKEGTERSTYGENDEDDAATSKVHQRSPFTLDRSGTGRTTITAIPPSDTPRDLRTELEFRDPSGQTQTVATTVPLWPGRLLPAIAVDALPDADGAKEPARRMAVRIGVVDVAGKPAPNARAKVALFGRTTYSNRARVVGGFYAYDHVIETKRLADFCEGTTDLQGMLRCEGVSPVAGEVVLEASVTDGDGHTTTAHGTLFLPTADEWWHRVEDSDRIDLIPERRHYEPGETASFLVRMPFREATVLVAVEREGVLDAHVGYLSGAHPVLQVPVTGAFAPNMFVSALVVRGRVGDVQPTALVDLGKPTFKLGIAEIEVGWKAHELHVRVAAEHPAYKVREKASVKVAVRTSEGNPPPPGSEVALAAVDEGLLELLPNRSWRVLEAMMGRRAYGVETSTAQMQVVGKRHYGTKAVVPGGGGGRQPTRELFDTLLLWRGRVPLDDAGRATVEIPLNDSLTSFRIVAVATGGLDAFGTGATTIRSTQDVMLLAGFPPVVREGDRFRAELTVRNTTDRPLELAIAAGVEAAVDPSSTTAERIEPPPPATVTVPPGEARPITWDVTVPRGAAELRWTLAARPSGAAGSAGVAAPGDALRVTQRVLPAVPVRTLQATLAQVELEGLRLPVARPTDALPDRGDVRVVLAPSLTAGLDGVRAWMRSYPYSCLEQRVSRAVALEDPLLWDGIAASLPSFQDGDGFLKYFATLDQGSDVLTSYVLDVTTAAGLALPDGVRQKMIDGLTSFVNGKVDRRGALPAADLVIRKLAALAALARVGAALPELVRAIVPDPNLWPTSAVLDWWSVLLRVPNAPGHAAALRAVEQIMRARLVLSGTTLGFSTDGSDGLFWLMVGPDTNALRLVLLLLEHDLWHDDLPRLVRGALGRQTRGTWSSTVANAWGTIAVERFAAAFESEAVAGTTTATLAAASSTLDWSRTPTGGALDLAWPSTPSELIVAHAGAGKPWATVQSRAAIPLGAPLASGYRITRTVTPLDVRTPGTISAGDTMKVRLTIEAEADMTWVVVDDPLPAGAQHIGTGLGGDAEQSGAASDRGPVPVFVERPFDGFHAYFDFVPKGTAVVEYALRMNQPGHYALPPTRVEALYAPEVFGEIPNAPVEVVP